MPDGPTALFFSLTMPGKGAPPASFPVTAIPLCPKTVGDRQGGTVSGARAPFSRHRTGSSTPPFSPISPAATRAPFEKSGRIMRSVGRVADKSPQKNFQIGGIPTFLPREAAKSILLELSHEAPSPALRATSLHEGWGRGVARNRGRLSSPLLAGERWLARRRSRRKRTGEGAKTRAGEAGEVRNSQAPLLRNPALGSQRPAKRPGELRC